MHYNKLKGLCLRLSWSLLIACAGLNRVRQQPRCFLGTGCSNGPAWPWAGHLPLRPVFVFAVPLLFPPTRIHLSSTGEVNYWCQTLNCSETRLRNAVLAVGPLAADVRAYRAR